MMESLLEKMDSNGRGKQHATLAFSIVLIVLAGFSVSNRFIQDDAFITFRYADNLVRGNGIVWNSGERVEGYSDFLWLLIMSIPLRLGWDVIVFAQATGVGFFILTLLLTYRLALLVFDSEHTALFVVVLLGTNYSFSSYGTGGLETQMQTCILTGIIFLTLWSVYKCGLDKKYSLLLSILFGVSVLTKIDSLIVVGLCSTVILYKVFTNANRRVYWRTVYFLFTPFVLIVGLWLLWKMSFYGGIVPNSFYIKGPGTGLVWMGLGYVWMFLLSYLLVPFPLMFLAYIRRLVVEKNEHLVIISSLVVVWLAYVISIGGDFMEWRLFVPVLPLVFILITWLIFRAVKDSRLQVLLVLLIFVGDFHHIATFQTDRGYFTYRYGVESIRALDNHVSDAESGWIMIGKTLGRAFNYSDNVTIATTASGAIPFYSRLKTVDMLGLNDGIIGKNCVFVNPMPGHRCGTTYDRLSQRGVSLVVGHPWVSVNITKNRKYTLSQVASRPFISNNGTNALLDKDVKVVEIPMDAGSVLSVVYLVENPEVDEAIEKNGWRTYPIGR
jgi:arabinofuranosyltransferase